MKKVTTILALMLIPNSYALELEGINGVDILAINGKTVETSFFSSKSANELEAGQHQVVVRYSAKFNQDELIESRPAIFTLDLQQDTQISVTDINSHQQAKQAARNGVNWQIINQDTQYTIADSDTLSGEGFMPYSDIEGLVATYNKKHNIIIATAEEVVAEPVAQVAPTIIGATATTAVSSTPKVSAVTTSGATVDLISSYQQATKAEKKAFRLWLLEQDMK